MELSPRERVIKALRHEEPDRGPLAFGGGASTIEREAYEKLKKYLDISSPTVTYVRDHVAPDERILERLGSDIRFVRPKFSSSKIEEDNSYVDDWGTRWKKPPSSLYWDMVDFPLKRDSLEEIEGYSWPNVKNPARLRGAKEEAKVLHEEGKYVVAADLICYGVFELAWALRGFENFLSDLASNPKFTHVLLEKIVELQKGLFEEWLDQMGEYVDIVMVSDDVGIQNGLMISPRMYRKMIKPHQRELWGFIKKRTNAYLFLHSCGSVFPLIGDFIELGIDILNPVQPLAKDMDTKRLKEMFGDKISFWGGIDIQEVLPGGDKDKIEKEVRKRIEDLSPGGGYILSPAHNIQMGVKPENLVFMFDKAKETGHYPINKGRK